MCPRSEQKSKPLIKEGRPKLVSCVDTGFVLILHRNIDQTLLNSLHGLLDFEIGGLRCRGITTEYRTHVSIVYTCNIYFAMHWSM